MNDTQIGIPRPRLDAKLQVTGQTQFVADLYLPGMLYAKARLSPEHHARIIRLDTRKAERLPGVRAIATAKDVPNNTTGQVIRDQPVFADDKVRYRGEPIALVAADTEEIAQEAVELIEVEFERLPAVFDAREALQPGAPMIHEEGQGTLCKGNLVLAFGAESMRLVHGDVEKGFAEADFILDETISTSSQLASPIEPYAYLAKPELSGVVTIWSNSQVPFMVSQIVAPTLNLPLNKVRIVAAAVGGGFGQKAQMMGESNVAVLAMKAGRPVRWALTTKEHFLVGTTKAPHYTTFKLGLKKDGSLTAVRRTHIVNAGAYGSTALLTSGKCKLIGSGPYRIPNQFSEIWIAYTNKPQSGSFRGFGISQAAFAFETMMDLAAKKIGMDPMEFRLRNALVDGDTCGTGQTMHSVGMTACFEKVRAASGWDQRKGKAGAASAD